VGDTIDVKGPVGHYVYEGRGAFTNNRKPGSVKHISLIAGGTGAWRSASS
jgi:nitrate reductase (NAD(P)H)